MNKILLVGVTFLICFSAAAQSSNDSEYQKKVKTLDSTIETLYAVISGEAGEKRDWDLFHFLFTADAKLIPTRKSEEGEISARYMSSRDYQESSGAWLEKNGFFEIENHRVTERFGNIAHIFSTYDSYRTAADKDPFMRGINSIQLLNDGNRWWIINIYWMGENQENKLPKKYLKK